ncbi:GntR family transcriptional regulator [Microbacterium sp.]|uniref:GntR family transcriptional regulator n=1 Tax=Microbacterium TaxID=33882 RepID=UPI0025E0554D|nr:GntR family transcriptional regulator [uncultured Microbacterium sp.]
MSEFPVGELHGLKGALVPAYRQIANELRRVIEVHKLQPGTKLPSETELVAKFDVARMTAREALRVLKAEGVIRSEQGRGVFVDRELAPKRLQMGETTAPNEGEWRERIHGVLVAGRGGAEASDDGWARSALLLSTGSLVAISVHLEPAPGRRDETTVFVPGDLDDAHSRAAEALAAARQWIVSVRVNREDPAALLVTRIGLDGFDRPVIASIGSRSGSWPVTTTETI